MFWRPQRLDDTGSTVVFHIDPQSWLGAVAGLAIAAALGALIGYERQRRQRMAGLRTNALVALGSAAFCLLGILMPEEISPTRVAAQVVSGIGFLCAGVIIRDGLNVRGLNTAATLWCSAAVGVLAGSGFPGEAVIIALLVVAAHALLRPLAKRVNSAPLDAGSEVDGSYQIELRCPAEDEAEVRQALIRAVGKSPLSLDRLHSRINPETASARIRADLGQAGRNIEAVEKVVARLRLNDAVTEAGWHLLDEGGQNRSRQGLFGS